MDLFTLENSRIIITQKEEGISCNRMGLMHSSKSNMMKMKKRLIENKSAKDTRWFEVTKHVFFHLIIYVSQN